MNGALSEDSGPSDRSRHDKSLEWAPCRRLVQTLREIQAMYAHATGRGMAIPPETAQRLAELIQMVGSEYEGDGNRQSLATAMTKALDLHARLSALVAPAKPSTLASNADSQERGHRLSVWLIAATGLGGLTLFAVFGRAVVGTQDPLTALSSRAQLACAGAAILGAGFYSTFEASKYLIEGTYNAQYTGVYVIRFFLGIVAGMLMANFGTAWIHPDSELGKFGVATLALLGGYSADAVNRILMRFSETLSTFVQGNAGDKAKDDEIRRLKIELETERTRSKGGGRSPQMSEDMGVGGDGPSGKGKKPEGAQL